MFPIPILPLPLPFPLPFPLELDRRLFPPPRAREMASGEDVRALVRGRECEWECVRESEGNRSLDQFVICTSSATCCCRFRLSLRPSFSFGSPFSLACFFYFWHFLPLSSFFGTHFFSSSLCALFASFIFDTFSLTEKIRARSFDRFSFIYTNLRQEAAARAKKNNKKIRAVNSAGFPLRAK